MQKTALIIAAWSGERRIKHKEYLADCGFYLKLQVAYLQQIPHNLTNIIIVVNANKPEPKPFTRVLDSLPRKIRDAKVNVLRRPNVGMSYGAFSHAYETFRDAFQWYIFTEDDYIFTLPFFDSILIKIFESTDNCGYLCGVTSIGDARETHAAVCIGITRSDILERVRKLYGELPHCKSSIEYSLNEQQGQIAQTAAIAKATGKKICDLKDYFRIPYVRPKGSVIWWHEHNISTIFSVAQMLELPKETTDAKRIPLFKVAISPKAQSQR